MRDGNSVRSCNRIGGSGGLSGSGGKIWSSRKRHVACDSLCAFRRGTILWERYKNAQGCCNLSVELYESCKEIFACVLDVDPYGFTEGL